MKKFWTQALKLAALPAAGFLLLLSSYKKWLVFPVLEQLSQDQILILMVLFLVIVLTALYFSFKSARESTDEELMIYQAAFLWHGITPPGIKNLFKNITPEIQETKQMLHEAANTGRLKISREVSTQMGVTKLVKKSELRRFAKSIKEKPKFLK